MPSPSIQVRCRLCGAMLPGWLRVDNKPNGTMLLNYLSMMHPAEVKPYLDRMRTEDIGTVAVEAFERINPPRGRGNERQLGAWARHLVMPVARALEQAILPHPRQYGRKARALHR